MESAKGGGSRPWKTLLFAALGLGLLVGCGAAPAQREQAGALRLETVADGLEFPWGLAFLPDGRMLVTERAGRMRVIDAQGRKSEPLQGLPRIAVQGQGGLLDVAVSPTFARDQQVFFAYSEPAEGGSRTAVARAVFADDKLRDVQVIFRQQPATSGGFHFGSRLVFGRDGNLWITLGDRYSGRAGAQKLDNHFGKVVRIRPDGSAPPDNPYRRTQGALPEIWSIGHRNVQGAALHPATGRLWTHEHGAQGGDEVNVDMPGRNYGWPVITWGVEYGGAPIGEGTHKKGMEQPLHYWVPSIAPSGMIFYTGDKFPEWRGSLLIGSLKFTLLSRLELDGEKVVREEKLLQDRGERFRDVRQGPDGWIYLLTNSPDAKLLRLMR
ncbi:MAG TPA: PQQ-dependent sugar dehydrogenase [Burkholderiaceae bacterium]|nr:PQQ-dependent sugar dehydrogenase [Burkholderiaceae bacterium]